MLCFLVMALAKPTLDDESQRKYFDLILYIFLNLVNVKRKCG